MKWSVFIFVIAMIACSSGSDKSMPAIHLDSDANGSRREASSDTLHHTSLDSVVIVGGDEDTLRFSRTEYNAIVDAHPEFFRDEIENPDITYRLSGDEDNFGSEQGQDSYFQLYAHFLRQRDSQEVNAVERRKLVKIFSCINSIFAKLENGGTFFGHQYYRIPAYAEYSIHQKNILAGSEQRTYNVSKQRDIYIQSLRQLIDDEVMADFDTPRGEKTVKRAELNQIVDQLAELITSKFFLSRALEFQHDNYD